MSKHECSPMEPYCVCYVLADEPDEECPIHGGVYVPERCVCGRFVKATRENDDAGVVSAVARLVPNQ